jgi:hypothetical protein
MGLLGRFAPLRDLRQRVVFGFGGLHELHEAAIELRLSARLANGAMRRTPAAVGASLTPRHPANLGLARGRVARRVARPNRESLPVLAFAGQVLGAALGISRKYGG